jgi:hypothetical protein
MTSLSAHAPLNGCTRLSDVGGAPTLLNDFNKSVVIFIFDRIAGLNRILFTNPENPVNPVQEHQRRKATHLLIMP